MYIRAYEGILGRSGVKQEKYVYVYPSRDSPFPPPHRNAYLLTQSYFHLKNDIFAFIVGMIMDCYLLIQRLQRGKSFK